MATIAPIRQQVQVCIGKAVRGASSLHWVHAFGLIDNDRRSEDDVAALHEKGIHALALYSVESIYYHPHLQRLVADRHAAVTGESSSVLIETASERAIAALIPHETRLCERVVEKALRDELERCMPTREVISAGESITVSLDVRDAVEGELLRFRELVHRKDLSSLIARYPVRETPALTEISKRLGFQGRTQYESAIRKLLMDDSVALEFVRGLFGDLGTELAAS